MTYRYEDLGDERFQRLVAAIVLAASGPDGRAMPLGQKDGGRDVVDGDGVVYQVKFSGDGARMRNADTWMLSALEGESESIRGLVDRGTSSYVLVTNVAGTAALDSGTIDKVSLALPQLAADLGLESLRVWWRDDVDARFAAAPGSVRRTFLRALPPDEQLAATLLSAPRDNETREKALLAYMAEQYRQDQQVRFEQADLNGPTVDKLFVDVPVTAQGAGLDQFALLDKIGSPLDDAGQGSPRAAGAARLLLHPDWNGHAVIVGGPGTGKTTLLQLICQVHRARHLNKTDYANVATGPVTALARVPVRIELRRYAQWPGKKIDKNDSAVIILRRGPCGLSLVALLARAKTLRVRRETLSAWEWRREMDGFAATSTHSRSPEEQT